MPRIIEAMLYFFSGFFPRRKRKILFGAWHGKKFSDNPKYLLLHLAKQGKCFDLVWIGNEEVRVQIPDDLPIRFVRKDSWAAKWEMLTAKTVFVTHANTDIGKKNLMRGACRVYLGHGLAIKHMGAPDNPLKNPIINTIRKAIRNVFSFRYYSASSKAHHIKLLKEYAISNATEENIRHWGQPRIDYLIENSTPSARTKLREQYFEKYDVPTEGKIITYLPTFRDKGVPAFSFCELDAKQRELLDKVISENAAIILEKSHFAEAPNKKKGDRSDRILSLSTFTDIDTQELLLITDLLITDYSGCYVDFLVLNRPILHFAYDREYYETSDRGLYFNLDNVAGGPILERFEEMCSAISESLLMKQSTPQQIAAKRMLTEFETGTACRQLEQHILGV